MNEVSRRASEGRTPSAPRTVAADVPPAHQAHDVSPGSVPFPGRWVGGVSLILGPLVLLAGILLRLPFHFFFPQQLAAVSTHPARMAAAYGAVAAGNAILVLAIAALAQRIGATRPGWAVWGGTLATLGLLARTFDAGVDHLAFQLVRLLGVERATAVVASSYGAFHVFQPATPAIMAGWIVLAIGAYRSGIFGAARASALALTSALMIGVLKGSSAVSVIATAGLCVALVPLGVAVLRDGPTPSRRALLGWTVVILAVASLCVVLGELG